jgi:hypothetical protein
MAKAILDGERYGGLVPDGDTAVRVDSEALSFALSSDLATAAVTAAYWLRNTGAAAEAADVAFAFTRGEQRDDDPGARASVEVDGVPLQLHSMRDVDLLGPRLHGWLDEHPDVDRALQKSSPDEGEGQGSTGEAPQPQAVRTAHLRSAVEEAGGRCDDGCAHLVSWYRSVNGDEEQHLSGRAEDEALLGAVREAIPGAVAELTGRWSTLVDREDVRLGFLLFHLDFEPGQRHAVTVRYVHRAEVDRSGYVNSTYGFDYLLSPARRWAGFGPLDISVHVPGRARFASRPPLQRDGDTWHAALPGLPPGELRFEVMSLDGLWLGMTQPGGYWAITVAAMTAIAIAVGSASGRVFGGGSRWRRLLLPLVTAAPLAAVCALALLVLLLIVFPHHALGFGYGGLAGGALLVLLSAPLGAVASAVTGARTARRARRARHGDADN